MLDTSLEAARIQEEVQRNQLPSNRMLVALEMSIMARALTYTRLHREHPDWDESRIRAELLRNLLPAGHSAAR